MLVQIEIILLVGEIAHFQISIPIGRRTALAGRPDGEGWQLPPLKNFWSGNKVLLPPALVNFAVELSPYLWSYMCNGKISHYGETKKFLLPPLKILDRPAHDGLVV